MHVASTFGRRTGLTRGNGVVTSYGYDAASRLSSLSQDLSGTSADQTSSFTFNAASQILTRAGTNAAYDPPAPSATTRNYTLNGRNQVTAVGAQSITHDSMGNLLADGTRTYGYDYLNRLTGSSGGTSLTVTYDPLGRINYTSNPNTTRFAYDGSDLIGEYDWGGGMLRRYVHGPGMDEPLVWYEGSGTSDRRWLIADERGSIVAVTDGTGASTAINTYDEYGVPGASNSGRFQYTGQTWLPEAGLYHYKARAYSPSLGRFMQTDPIGYLGGMNLYAYVGNDPVNFVDPWGLQDTPMVDTLVVTAEEDDSPRSPVLLSMPLYTGVGGPPTFASVYNFELADLAFNDKNCSTAGPNKAKGTSDALGAGATAQDALSGYGESILSTKDTKMAKGFRGAMGPVGWALETASQIVRAIGDIRAGMSKEGAAAGAGGRVAGTAISGAMGGGLGGAALGPPGAVVGSVVGGALGMASGLDEDTGEMFQEAICQG